MQESVLNAVNDIKSGRLIIVTDDANRENEGDLVCAAALTTPTQMAFILRHCCGIVCTPLSDEIARRLDLAPMVSRNSSAHHTAFTVSVDAKVGTSTGISAIDRTHTVRALADPHTRAEDFARPGHIFPLLAKPNGVLDRPGHTEAAVDLCRLAGLPEVGVICELMNDDGSVQTRCQLDDFAVRYGIRKISVQDLIDHRLSLRSLQEAAV